MSVPERLLLPAATSPRCGSAPRLRIPEAERDHARTQPPEVLKSTVQCQRCQGVYRVTAGAYARAL